MFSAGQSRLGSIRIVAVIALCAIAALFVALAAPSRADAARTRCAGLFRVLHNDHVGRMSLPRGGYRITTLSSGRPNCAHASALFTRFLEDWDGRLPGGWRVAAASKTFLRAPGVGFHVARNGSGGGGGNEEEESGGSGRHGQLFCPGTFRVLNDDRIGPLRLAKGRYWIIRLQPSGLACGQASRLFTRFLDDFNGVLPAPWILEPQTASFRRSASGAGFRVKPVS